ncbi:hypothetical protein HOK40_00500 [Candidatus Peregrinibacteria bacterium]|nr:hypothetical protein [Candidatus Peregrinibacteria bacterium]
MEELSIFILGFIIKVVTGVDDILTRVPVVAAVAKSKAGKIVFSLGAITAVAVATLIAYFLSSFIQDVPAYRYIISGLIFILAVTVYFNVFAHKPASKVAKRVITMQNMSRGRFWELFAIGFAASFITVLDDVIAFTPIFFHDFRLIAFGVAGILTATVCQAALVVYASGFLMKIPHKEKIAAAGLVLLSLGMLLGML